MAIGSINRIKLAAFMVLLICLLVYLPALTCGFINLDDPAYVLNNPGIRHWSSALFAQVLPGSWTPLTLISFAIDYQIWGVNPLGYHLTNILLHACNAGLVVLIADALCRRGDGAKEAAMDSLPYLAMLVIAGLLWGLHPLRVESVAWVSARKDVLNGILTLAAVVFYLRYVRAAARNEKLAARRDYLLSLILFLLSLLAKQMSVTLPVLLLLVDWFPLGRLQRGSIVAVLREKIPYLVVSLAITIITIVLAQQAQQFTDAGLLSFPLRCLVSGNAVFEYCRLLLYPVGIIPYYVLDKAIPYAFAVKSGVVVVATCACLSVARKRPAVTVVWLLFLVPLVPVLGFLQSGDDLALAARYTYLPAVAPSIGAAALIGKLLQSLVVGPRRLLLVLVAALIGVVLLCYAAGTIRLVKSWENTGTFWSRVIMFQHLGRAYGERGLYYLIQGRPQEAIADLTVAIPIAEQGNIPVRYNLYAFRGVSLSDLGRYEEAIQDFSAAIELLPHPTYFQYRGKALQALGRMKEAAEDLRRAGPNPPPIDRFGMNK